MAKLNRTSIVAHGDGFIEAEVDGEVVALNADKGMFYGLNKVGTRIWRQIAEPKRIGDLCTALISEYEVDDETCEREVLDLLEELLAEGMIELREEPTVDAR